MGLTVFNLQPVRERAIELRRMGYSYNAISKALGVPVGTLENWILYGKRAGCPRRLKVKVAPSNDLAYLIGVFLGDLNTYRHGGHYYISTRVKDKSFAEAIARSLRGLGLRAKVGLDQGYYSVRTYSKLLFDWLRELRLEEVKGFIKGYEADFLRGFYDSEGNWNYRGWLRMANTRKDVIGFVKEVLREAGINFTEYVNDSRSGNRKVVYGIQIARKEDRAKFFNIIGTNIPRKLGS